MKKLHSLRLQPATPWQRERLIRWLHEWETETALRDPAATTAPAGSAARDPRPLPAELSELVHPPGSDPAPAPGQIRLMAPVTAAEGQHLLYVAVLRIEDGGARLLLAPFGRFM